MDEYINIYESQKRQQQQQQQQVHININDDGWDGDNGCYPFTIIANANAPHAHSLIR